MIECSCTRKHRYYPNGGLRDTDIFADGQYHCGRCGYPLKPARITSNDGKSFSGKGTLHIGNDSYEIDWRLKT
jgi:hypothetical protein